MPGTVTAADFVLSPPRQAPAAGVTVYCHDPAATPVSTQLVPETVPPQPFAAG